MQCFVKSSLRVLFLNRRKLLKSTISAGSSFQALMTRTLKKYLRVSVIANGKISLYPCPRVLRSGFMWKKSSRFSAVNPNSIL